jgi:hypothetical protein
MNRQWTARSPISTNAPDYPLAGAITAALFLNRFISQTQAWAHFDIPAWIDRPKPGRRKGGGGERAFAASYAVNSARYAKRCARISMRAFRPARPDIAAAFLKGKVALSKNSPEGRMIQCFAMASVDLCAAPSQDAGLHTQLSPSFGENLPSTKRRTAGSGTRPRWIDMWVTPAASISAAPGRRQHIGLFLFPRPLLNAPDVKKGAPDMLPMNAKLAIAESGDRFVRLADGGYAFGGHLAPLGQHAADWVDVAEQFVGIPYVWGGKTSGGHRLFGTGANRTAKRRNKIAARHRHDGSAARNVHSARCRIAAR